MSNMENNKDLTIRIIIACMVIMFMIIIGLTVNHTKENITTAEQSYTSSLQRQDSLQNIIDSLQTQLEVQEKIFINNEQRYNDILFEYEYGVERLKETHPSAYKEFHRIIAFKERYSVEDKIDNNKRLKLHE